MNDKTTTSNTKRRLCLAAFHIVAWLLVVLPAVLFVPGPVRHNAEIYALRLCLPLMLCAVFYANYLFLVPRCFVRRRFRAYACANLVMLAVLSLCMDEMMTVVRAMEFTAGARPPGPPPMRGGDGPGAAGMLSGFVRNVFPLLLSAALATSLRLALRWREAEDARRELEARTAEAELSNLRNQINPHFLLNTLNNIYALISIDADRAGRAVLTLAELLRQMLYGGKGNSVRLADEARFLHNYVGLMKLRVGGGVRIDFATDVPDDDDVRVAPFIFISLVENAFKHGISPTRPSFITIRLGLEDGAIVFDIRNSNHPKGSADRSGHGIGLGQAARRLELAYPGRHEWTRGVDPDTDTYYSKITIFDTKMRDTRR